MAPLDIIHNIYPVLEVKNAALNKKCLNSSIYSKYSKNSVSELIVEGLSEDSLFQNVFHLSS